MARHHSKITRTQAQKIREILEASVSSPESIINDSLVSFVPNICSEYKADGSLVKAGTRINHNNIVLKATVDLWGTAENSPDNAPELWKEIPYHDGYRIIPEVITVTAKFSKGECGWWNGVLYESLYDSNVYNPSVVPTNWKIVE